LGKTHLLFAIAHEMKIVDHDMNIVYVKAESFMNEFIDAIQSKRYERNNEFRKKYREADILLIDDIQVITSGDKVQDEFFHTYNMLFDSGKPIVLTSDRPPREMLKLEERLRSRFTSGLIVLIEPPDFETRMAMVMAKTKELNMKIGDDIIKLIANNITQNVRMIEGVVKKLHAYSQLNESTTSVDIDTAKKILQDMVIEQKKATPEQIIERVGKYYDIPPEKITGDSRDKPISLARQVSIYLIREITGLTYDDIGKIFGNKDHTTIIHARKKIEKELVSNPELSDVIRNIITDIEENNQVNDF
jgi:chromosomal replication initiator protein